MQKNSDRATVAALYERRFFLESTKYRRSSNLWMNCARASNVVAGFSPRSLSFREPPGNAG